MRKTFIEAPSQIQGVRHRQRPPLPLMRKTFIEAWAGVHSTMWMCSRLFRLCGRLSLRPQSRVHVGPRVTPPLPLMRKTFIEALVAANSSKKVRAAPLPLMRKTFIEAEVFLTTIASGRSVPLPLMRKTFIEAQRKQALKNGTSPASSAYAEDFH